jgi:hypothetical protein
VRAAGHSQEDIEMKLRKLTTALGGTLAAMSLLAANPVWATGNGTVNGGASAYDVTITNLTAGTTFTPALAVVHGKNISLFQLGEPASDGIAALAEAGDTQPIAAAAGGLPEVGGFATDSGPLAPGDSTTVRVNSTAGFERITVAAMLLPTNDGFYAINTEKLPSSVGDSVTYYANGYDAGTEPNDELCDNIPGELCGGQGLSPDQNGEGYVHVHRGIHGIGDIQAADHDWRNPVARIRITAVAETSQQ